MMKHIMAVCTIADVPSEDGVNTAICSEVGDCAALPIAGCNNVVCSGASSCVGTDIDNVGSPCSLAGFSLTALLGYLLFS